MNATTKRATRAATLCLTLSLGPALPEAALSPAQTDILGLRLGMPEYAVIETLLRQGITQDRIVRTAGPCGDVMPCGITLTAPTRDGEMTISLRSDPPVVDRITYRFRGRGAGEPAMIAESVLQHFGPPDQAQPMIWCHKPAADGACPATQPWLRFNRETLTLVLSSGSADPR